MFDGARDHDEERPPLNPERLARMAWVDDSGWLAPEPLFRRRRYGQAIVRGLVALAVAVAVAWVLSEIAVASLLDESRLALIGITA